MGNDSGSKEFFTTRMDIPVVKHESVDAAVMAAAAAMGSETELPSPPQTQCDAGEASTIAVNTSATTPTTAAPGSFPPPKTDKPRPHGCTTCGRAFARLEHLKRHERSHTKEKPFECPECKRCFARRDLLLRHQQKLHQTTTPSARPRNRRESASGAPLGQSRARKNSVAGPAPPAAGDAAAAAMRPRANTISAIDPASLQQILAGAAGAPSAVSRMPPTHSRHGSLIGLPFHNNFDNHHHHFPGMSAAMGHRGMQNALPRLETHGLPMYADTGLRTAPPNVLFRNSFLMGDGMFAPETINPSVLHCGTGPQSPSLDPISPSFTGIPDLSASSPYTTGSMGFENLMINTASTHHPHYNGLDFFNNANENAIEGSSPSAISTASPGGMSDAMIDGSNNPASTIPMPVTTSPWAQPIMSPHTGHFGFDFNNANHGFPDFMTDPVSPLPVQQQQQHHNMMNDGMFTPPSSLNSASPNPNNTNMRPIMSATLKRSPSSFASGPETPNSINGSTYGTSPVSTITDSTRHAILGALASTAARNTTTARKSSFSVQPSPLSLHAAAATAASPSIAPAEINYNNFASTHNLRRFAASYITNFHPHLPFLHVPTLSFDIPARSYNAQSGDIGGPACLALSMAAIGALFEHEHDQAYELFEMAKKMIQSYLEQRRKANVRKAYSGSASDDYPGSQGGSADTPIWLVQSMLLNVVFGHNCGDKRAGEIASTHCAALVSLARGAELFDPTDTSGRDGRDDRDVSMTEADGHAEWLRWKAMEERKRTLYAIFILSSLLVAAYNHTPTLTNAEILLDLPCDEEFYEAENSAAFNARGGVAAAAWNKVSFHTAFGELVRTNERNRRMSMHGGHSCANELPPSDLQPSTFGCLVLINALHNYIWETRQRHHNQIWTPEETERMHGTIEPALHAWHAAWKRSMGPCSDLSGQTARSTLATDCIPLMDLAHLRLFVNFGRSKELFWQRDWDGLADELARGDELVQHAEHVPMSSESHVDDAMDISSSLNLSFVDSQSLQFPSNASFAAMTSQASLRREKLLQKAAFIAADSFLNADKVGVNFASLSSQELPLQSAMCAFDCAQVLAEWIAMLQDRVGHYLGVLGEGDVDFTEVPAIVILGDEDAQLLGKVKEILSGLEGKMRSDSIATVSGGYAVRILKVTAHLLNRADVWPVTRLMAQCLETHADHVLARVERSVRGAE